MPDFIPAVEDESARSRRVNIQLPADLHAAIQKLDGHGDKFTDKFLAVLVRGLRGERLAPVLRYEREPSQAEMERDSLRREAAMRNGE